MELQVLSASHAKAMQLTSMPAITVDALHERTRNDNFS
jgi:hypothetical protein